jgi:hypothetical protein
MTCRRDELFFILLFAFGVFLSNAAQAQSCQPTLYLFRHGEDYKYPKNAPPPTPTKLTTVGAQHAALYDGMITQLQKDLGAQGPCPVMRVFAMWDRDVSPNPDKPDIRGTTNPLETARPLAKAVGLRQTPPNANYVPEMIITDGAGGNKYYLCEYLSNPDCERDAGIGTNPMHFNALAGGFLHDYLINYFIGSPGTSVAIFYTSQGMPGVSNVLGTSPKIANCSGSAPCTQIFPPTSTRRPCPLPNSPDDLDANCYQTPSDTPPGPYDPNLSWPGIARSSVDIFNFQFHLLAPQYILDTSLDGSGNLLQKLQFFQCYNLNHNTQLITPGTYYCQYSGNIANGLDNANSLTSTTVGKPKTGSPANISDIRGKICIAGSIKDNPVDRDTFGSCTGPSTGAPELAASQHDLDANMISDIVWRDTSGDIAIWLMSGTGVASSGVIGNAPTTWSIVGQRDFNGDGTADLLWRDSSGNTAIWFMNGMAVASTAGVGSVPMNWTVVATGDFNGDGMGDILWQDASGNLGMWLMNGATVLASSSIGNVPANWSLAGTGDFDGDGSTDLFWRDNVGNNAIWFMNGATITSTTGLGNTPTAWTVVGTGDFDGDGKSDVVWRDGSGNTAIWLMNGPAVSSAAGLGTVPVTWSIAQTGDFNGDGKSDLLWRDTSGNTAVWFLNGTAVASTTSLGDVPTDWTVQSVNAD